MVLDESCANNDATRIMVIANPETSRQIGARSIKRIAVPFLPCVNRDPPPFQFPKSSVPASLDRL
jgi:hypothetical protein